MADPDEDEEESGIIMSLANLVADCTVGGHGEKDEDEDDE